ncbi:MAG: NUDIX hydrolase [Leptospiraceae bacterium]|nr:NUDIX hydrolase [Leptospiraceae bacterium]
MHNIGSFGIILNESNEILLCLRNDKNIWNLPGGKVEVRESPFKACIREVKEETGLTVKLKKLIGVYLYTSKNKLVFTFLCKAISGKYFRVTYN